MHTAFSAHRPALATTSAAWVRLILNGAAQSGMSPEPLLKSAGIAREVLDDPGARVSQQQVTLLWQAVSAAYPGDDLALICGRGF